MTLTDELKILEEKIKANQAQYDLDRKAAKISALSSKELHKYEYLIGEDLGYKPGVVAQAKFEYSPLGKVFKKGLDKKKKKKEKGILIRLENIEDKYENQLKMIENKDSKQLDTKSVIIVFGDELSQEAKNILYAISNQQKNIDYKRLSFKRKKILEFDFSGYNSLKELFKDIYYKKLSIEKAEGIQEEFNVVLSTLKKYKPKDSGYKKEKINLLDNAKRFYDGREMIINAFKKILPLNYDEEEQSHFEDENKIRYENGLIDYKNLDRLISLKERDINNELVKKHFLVQDLGILLKNLRRSKNTWRNKTQVNMIKNGLRD